MKIRQEQEGFPRPRGVTTMLRTRNSNSAFSQRFSPQKGRARWDVGPIPTIDLGWIVASAAVKEERNRLAREIHDTLVQEFAGILLHLEAANGLQLAAHDSQCLTRAKELARSGLEDARRMLLGLRPKSLEGVDFCDALAQLAERFSRDCGIHCTFSVDGARQTLSEEIEDELYRVSQEALCNVRKHSRADSVSIVLSYAAARVVLSIEDNGHGLLTKQSQPGAHGFGLLAMSERASRLGGKIDINTGQGAGTEIRMSVPLPGKASKERNNQ